MPNTKIRASTQDHLDIQDIRDDLVILKTGWVALVITTTAVNFDILSEAEQDAIIYAYGALINSLSFPVQILVRTKRADITSYFNHLTEAARNQANPDLKRQIIKYQEFIKSTVQTKTVLDKQFYLVISFSPMELGLKGIKSKKSAKAKSKAGIFNEAKIVLAPKRDHLIKQLSRLGLSARQLTTQELIELYYDIYNPAPTGTQKITLDSSSYTAPIVQPALEVPTPQQPDADKTAIPPLQATPPSGNSPQPSPLNPTPNPPPVPNPSTNQSQHQPPNQQQPAAPTLSQQAALENLKEAIEKTSQLLGTSDQKL